MPHSRGLYFRSWPGVQYLHAFRSSLRPVVLIGGGEKTLEKRRSIGYRPGSELELVFCINHHRLEAEISLRGGHCG